MGLGQSTFPSLPSYVPPNRRIRYVPPWQPGYVDPGPGYTLDAAGEWYNYTPKPADTWPWSYTWNSRTQNWDRYNTNLGGNVPSYDVTDTTHDWSSRGPPPTTDPTDTSYPGGYSPPWDQPPPYDGSKGQNPSSGVYDDPTDTIRRYPQSKRVEAQFSFRQLPRRRRRRIIRKIFRR